MTETSSNFSSSSGRYPCWRLERRLTILVGLTTFAAAWGYFAYYPRLVGQAQPISFSHRIHATEKKISCVLCHPARSNLRALACRRWKRACSATAGSSCIIRRSRSCALTMRMVFPCTGNGSTTYPISSISIMSCMSGRVSIAESAMAMWRGWTVLFRSTISRWDSVCSAIGMRKHPMTVSCVTGRERETRHREHNPGKKQRVAGIPDCRRGLVCRRRPLRADLRHPPDGAGVLQQHSRPGVRSNAPVAREHRAPGFRKHDADRLRSVLRARSAADAALVGASRLVQLAVLECGDPQRAGDVRVRDHARARVRRVHLDIRRVRDAGSIDVDRQYGDDRRRTESRTHCMFRSGMCWARQSGRPWCTRSAT